MRRSVNSLLLVALAACAHPNHGIEGQWRLSWRGRIGTEQATVLLQPSGQVLTGSLGSAHGSLPLSGSVHGAELSFTVDFPGPPPYRIVFSGVAQGDRIKGEAQPQDTHGAVFAGHGGEISRDYYTWTALRTAPGN